MHRKVLVLIFVAGTLWAYGLLVGAQFKRHAPAAEEAAIGVHLARGDGFRSPMDPSPTAPPSAWSPPVYPAIIAVAYRSLGVGSSGALTALALLNAIAYGCVAASLAAVALNLFGNLATAVLGVLLFAIHPLFLAYVADFWDGFLALALFLLLLNLTIGIARYGFRAQPKVAPSIGLGVLMGLLALTNVSYVATYPLLASAAFWHWPRVSWRSLMLCLMSLAFVAAPWTVRNVETFHRFVWVRTGVGLQFWLGNEPVSSGWLDAHAYAFHPYANPTEREELLRVGEPQYDDEVFGRFVESMQRSPLIFAENCGRRLMYMLWGKRSDQFGSLAAKAAGGATLAFSVVTLVCAIGGMVAAHRLRVRQYFLPAVVAALTVPFVPTAVIDRYRLPVEALLILYAAALVPLIARGRARPQSVEERDDSARVRAHLSPEVARPV